MTAPQIAPRSVAPQQVAPRAHAEALVGFGTLLRLYARVSRIRLTVWVVGLTALNVVIAVAFPGLYPDATARQQRAVIIGSSPAAVSFSGPGFGLHDYTFGAMLSNEMLGFVAVLIALMAVFLVVRHAREEEQVGRTELVRAGIVGRHAPMAAVFALAALASIAVGLLTAVGLALCGVPSLTVGGSLVYGAALSAVGLAFAGIGLLTSQIAEHARTASGLAGLAIGIAYLLRAVGDIGENALRWLSPIGWAQQTAPYVLNRVWPLLISIGVTILLVVLAVLLNDRRDHGAGMVQPRPGPARGSAMLGTPLGLAVRLQRGTVIAWALSLIAFAAIYGTLMSEVRKFASQNPVIQEVLAAQGGSLLGAFLAMIVGLLAMFAGIFAIQSVLRIRSEQTSGRAEPVLAASVSRTSWAGPHIAIAIVAGALVTLLAAAALGVSGALALGSSEVAGDALAAASANLPALMVIVGIAVLLVGWLPQLAALSWLVIGWAIFAGMLGGLLQLPTWAMDLSPFAHVPRIPGEAMSWPPMIIMTVLGVALLVAGLVGLRRRDIYTT